MEAGYNKKLKTDEILKIVCNVIDSIELVHSIGYTHNDLKPHNIMIT